jgi:tetratricopeptide (TPR) repeat protein
MVASMQAESRSNPTRFESPEVETLVASDLIIDGEADTPTPADTTLRMPLPANAIELWQRGFDRSDDVARAVVAIIARNPSYLEGLAGVDRLEQRLHEILQSEDTKPSIPSTQLAACQAALGALAQAKGELDKAEGFYRAAIDLQKEGLGLWHEETLITSERLARLLDQMDREVEAAEIRRTLSIGQMMQKGGSLEVLRTKALELVLEAQSATVPWSATSLYSQAENIYRYLLEQGFEAASTHCHIARVCLLTEREIEAAEEADRASDIKYESPAYVRPRILFIRMLCAILSGKQVDTYLQQINSALSEPGCFVVWTMQPVIDHFKFRFSPEQYVLLTALVEATGDPQRFRKLNEILIWRKSTGNVSST